MTLPESKHSNRWTIRDLVMISIISSLVGIANIGFGTLYATIDAALGPLGGAIINGVYMWGFFMAFYFVRKPGCMLLVGLLEASLGAILGAPSGIYTLGWGITEGLGAEIIFAIAGYDKIEPKVFALAGAGAAQLQTVWSWYIFGWHSTMAMYWLSIPISMISGAFASGLLGYWLAKYIHNTGLIHPNSLFTSNNN